MNNVIHFIKLEFSGWNNSEKIFVPILLLMVMSLSVYMNDSFMATLQAVFSLSYSIMAGKGKISCYIFGILATLCYLFLSLKNALYGHFLLHLCYFLPMEVIGIFAWKNKLKPESQEVKKTKLNIKQRFLLLSVIIVSAVLFSFLLRYWNDRFPLMDAFSTVLSICAMYLTIKRCIEQWILWTGVNILCVIMWFFIYTGGSQTFATMLTWSIHLFLGIYFFCRWYKEVYQADNIY